MSSLSERLKAKKPKIETVEVDGEKYIVSSKGLAERGRLYALARRKDGTLDNVKLESILLHACVTDETGATATAAEWAETQTWVTGPILNRLLTVNAMTGDDVKDPKDSDSTES